MTAVNFLMTAASLAALFLVVLCVATESKHRRLSKKYNKLLSESGVRGKIPVGAKYFYDRPSGKKCRRCKKGRIKIRHRFQLVSNSKGETIERKLTHVCWCTSCQYRGVLLEKHR